ncbi:MAG: hypothetical protein H0W48_10120 [Methylibium sp.]|uniref:hypothetical protein n=1 Tax=Methylibium sp. TaxID=2067992 RepID=UPI0017DF0960|nr:hypothetical protein [Methylibium sp.]MBA2721722.1 hypothetical protein [Methylibium sp.]MBA3590420.1 hypothetical protein [Methylibium sp.]MBA3624783.1 hypothetical protein [Methylibium sp.]
MINRWIDRLAGAVSGALALALQLLLAAAGLVFVLGAMTLGLALGGLLVLWALLRGRRPVLRYGMPPAAAWARFHETASRRRAGHASSSSSPRSARQGEVIDAEVREVPDRQPGSR